MSKLPSMGRPGGSNVLATSTGWLASIAAVVVTFFLGPSAFDLSKDWIAAFTAAHYGAAWVSLVLIGWFALCLAFVFFLSRLVIAIALMLGNISVISRFF